ncbi:MAG: hypothetical protein HQM10_17600 [Candidatus Riflebacteria bacterium]|nr:hypothetical protein [Candidatus Riflebacteria bacterium]
MDLLLNGQPLSVDEITSESDLAELVELLDAECGRNDLTIVKIIVDGNTFSPEDKESLKKVKILDHEKVEIEAQNPMEIVREGVETSSEVLPYFKGISDKIINALRLGNVKEAMDNYMPFIEGLTWLSMILQYLSLGYAGKTLQKTTEESRKLLLSRFLEQMGGLCVACENKDWVTMADILEYEFPEIFDSAGKFLGEIAEYGRES